MHREIRRKDRQMPHEEAIELLRTGEYGVLATVNPDNTPYTIPISYLFDNNKLYFHSATQGQKIDNIKQNPAATFTVVGGVKPVQSKGDYSTLYESVIAFGKLHIVNDPAEMRHALYALTEKYFPDGMDGFEEAFAGSVGRVCVIVMDVEHISGKANK